MIRVAVTGAKGRMGSTVVSAVTDAPDMEVVALFDAGDEITAQSVNGAQVAVDFVGAGNGETVLVTTGSSARMSTSKEHSVIDAAVVGIVDSLDLNGQ